MNGDNRAAGRNGGSRSSIRVFFLESLRSFTVTASLFPSSRFLASAMLRPIDFRAAAVIVELGVGTGAFTIEMLRRMAPHARLYALEINPTFIEHVRHRIRDPRFVPILARAEDLDQVLLEKGVERADAIVSSLGLSNMGESQRCAIVGQAIACLAPGGVLTQFQYLHAAGEPNWFSALGLPRFSEEEFLRSYFRQVHSEKVLWNLPPATVFACRP